MDRGEFRFIEMLPSAGILEVVVVVVVLNCRKKLKSFDGCGGCVCRFGNDGMRDLESELEKINVSLRCCWIVLWE